MLELPFAAVAPRPEAANALVEVSRSRNFALGEFLDSSVATAKAIDREALRQFRKKFGRVPADLGVLEADLIVTTAGLFYIAPRTYHVWRRGWNHVFLSIGKPGRKFGSVTVVDRGGHKRRKIEIRASAAANLRVIAEYYGSLA